MPTFNQTYSTGSVAAFNGGAGLLETLLGVVLGTEVSAEIIDATPNGSKTSFSGTLAQSPCGLGRLTVDYTIGAVGYEATDDGSGAISGTNISSGSITYSTGAWAITFSTAPDNLTNITADYIYGNPGADWQQKVKEDTEDDVEATPFGTDCKQVILHNTGITGAENVLIGIREWEYVAGNAYGWDLNGYTAYNSGQTWHASNAQHGLTGYDSTYEHWDEIPMLPLIDSTMYYWIYSNRQRIVIVVKVQSNYESAYLGFGRRFGAASDYPYPLVIKGSAYGNVNYSDSSAFRTYAASNVWSSAGYPLLAVDPGSSFIVCGGAVQFEDGVKVQPAANYGTTDGTVTGTKTSGEILMTPAYMTQPSESRVLMDLDGVTHLAATGIQSEDTLYEGGLRHRIFQNVHRTAHYEFMAVEENTTTTTTSSTTSTTTSTTSTTSTTTSSTTSTTTSSTTSSTTSTTSTTSSTTSTTTAP